MMEICFGSTKMAIFYREKALHARKRIRKNGFAPQKNMPVMPLIQNKVHWKRSTLGSTSLQRKKALATVAQP